MLRFCLLSGGLLFLIFNQFVQPVALNHQFLIFFAGIFFAGVPHGAADLLVGIKNAERGFVQFSKISFFRNYLLRLVGFAILLWFFPLIGNLFFIVFAAYHFGETDLCEFQINSIRGKVLVISYGLLILGFILLTHFEEVVFLIKDFEFSNKYPGFIARIREYRIILLCFLIFFFCYNVISFFNRIGGFSLPNFYFIVQLCTILFVLYFLPMVLSFSFYFIFWHSVLSLSNIFKYLRKDGFFNSFQIVRQIGLYSILAVTGILIFGFTMFKFLNREALMIYVLMGLAVLTAPHMQIMHEMYIHIRDYKRVTPT